MADLTAQDVQNVLADVNKYADEVDSLAKANGVDVKIAGNDPAALTAAAAAGAAAGAGGAAAFSAAAGPFAPAVIAVGAIIGALAGFFAKFHFGPTPEAIALTKEFGDLTGTINKILSSVPQPYRDQIALFTIRQAKTMPGPFPFCLEGGGCAMTSITGLREAAGGLNDLIKDWLARAEAAQRPFLTPRLVVVGFAIVGVLGYAGYKMQEKRR